jgi:hypothetical protein
MYKKVLQPQVAHIILIIIIRFFPNIGPSGVPQGANLGTLLFPTLSSTYIFLFLPVL